MLENRPKSQAYSACPSHWRIDDQQWYLMCYSYPQDFQQRALQEAIPEMTWEHFDVLACVLPMECHALDRSRHLGCPPDVFPFGAQYGYSGHGTETFVYKYRFEAPEVPAALKAALPVARLHGRIERQEPVHFKILSDDGHVQETAFADSTRVVANFSRGFVGEAPGVAHKVVKGIGRLGPESWEVE